MHEGSHISKGNKAVLWNNHLAFGLESGKYKSIKEVASGYVNKVMRLQNRVYEQQLISALINSGKVVTIYGLDIHQKLINEQNKIHRLLDELKTKLSEYVKPGFKLSEFNFFDGYINEVVKNLLIFQQFAGGVLYKYISNELLSSLQNVEGFNKESNSSVFDISATNLYENTYEFGIIVGNLYNKAMQQKNKIVELGSQIANKLEAELKETISKLKREHKEQVSNLEGQLEKCTMQIDHLQKKLMKTYFELEDLKFNKIEYKEDANKVMLNDDFYKLMTEANMLSECKSKLLELSMECVSSNNFLKILKQYNQKVTRWLPHFQRLKISGINIVDDLYLKTFLKFHAPITLEEFIFNESPSWDLPSDAKTTSFSFYSSVLMGIFPRVRDKVELHRMSLNESEFSQVVQSCYQVSKIRFYECQLDSGEQLDFGEDVKYRIKWLDFQETKGSRHITWKQNFTLFKNILVAIRDSSLSKSLNQINVKWSNIKLKEANKVLKQLGLEHIKCVEEY